MHAQWSLFLRQERGKEPYCPGLRIGKVPLENQPRLHNIPVLTESHIFSELWDAAIYNCQKNDIELESGPRNLSRRNTTSSYVGYSPRLEPK